MEKVKLETEVVNIGKMSNGLINNNYLVLFDEDQEDFAQVFGFTVKHSPLKEKINIGDIVNIDDNQYKILEISEKTNENLKNITHLAFHIDREFDGPTQILLEGKQFPEVKEGTKIKIIG